MVEEKFILCRNCSEIHHVTPFDKTPTYAVVRGEAREIPTDDWRKFMERHAGHKLEGLKGVGEKHYPAGQPMGPMKVGYIEVTNGQDLFALRSSRKSVEEPLNFQLIRGRLTGAGVTVEVQEEEIKKEMKYHFSWAPSTPLGDEKSELFIRLFKEVARDLNPHEIKIGEYSYSDDSVAYGLLDSQIIENLMERCALHFLPAELEGIRRFVETHQESCDVMALLIRHHYRVEESVL